MKFKVFSSVTHMEKYCVIYDYWEAQKEYSEGPHITLVLHSTYSYLGYLEDQLKTWDGGISVSVFIPTPVDQKTDFVKILESQIHLRLFFSSISSPQAMWFKNFGKVSLHLFFKRKNFHRCPELLIPENMYSALGASLSDMKEFEDFTVIYPINAARNIARKGSKTKLFISGDIEQVYVKNFEPRMYQLAKKVLLEFVSIILFFLIQNFREKRKTVLVYRRFELDDASPMPQNKRQLRGLMVNKQAVEFHKYYNGGGHRIRNLHEWLDMVEDGKEVSIADEVLYRNKQWEPQFVADDRVPFHDERFPYRYKTNIHLVSLLITYSSITDEHTNSGPPSVLHELYVLGGF